MSREAISLKKIMVGIILIILGIPISSAAPIVEQCSILISAEEILYVGGTGPGNYSTIQSAIDAASSGDIVYVYDDSSPYTERILIDKHLTLLGENTETTILDAQNSGDVVTITGDQVTLQHFSIQRCGGTWTRSGIKILSDDNCISENILINVRNGIFLAQDAYNNTLDGNIIINNGYHGIRLDFTQHNTVTNNRILDNAGYGMYLWETSDNIITGNTIARNEGFGIHIGEFCENNLLYHNNIADNVLANGQDQSGNSWDNGVEGNYWGDYTGEDANEDGIGDTPYILPGGTSQDTYPLMAPYGDEQPEYTANIHGGVGINVRIRNTGIVPAETIEWTLDVTGGLLGLINKQFTDQIDDLQPGEEILIHSGLIVGLGPITISLTLQSEIIATTEGRLLGPFVFI